MTENLYQSFRLNKAFFFAVAALPNISQLVPGHEVVGEIVDIGDKVVEFTKGDRCVADNCSTVSIYLYCFKSPTGLSHIIECDHCFYCRRGKDLLCENFASKGVTMDGGFAEYVTL